MTASVDDRAAIERLHDDFGKAWSAGDGQALTAMFTDDAVRVGAMGDIQRGKPEILGSWQRLFSGPFRGATVRFTDVTTRVLSPEYGVWEAAIEIANADRPPVRGYVVDLMVKRDGRWLILETHPKLFVSPPPTTK